MKNPLKGLLRAGAIGLATIGICLATTAPAQAAEPVDMNLACQVTYNSTSYRGYLADSSNVWGWKCANRAWPYQSGLDVDVQKYCQVVYGLNAGYYNWSNPYSWYCG